jgi:hypothetical protein
MCARARTHTHTHAQQVARDAPRGHQDEVGAGGDLVRERRAELHHALEVALLGGQLLHLLLILGLARAQDGNLRVGAGQLRHGLRGGGGRRQRRRREQAAGV